MYAHLYNYVELLMYVKLSFVCRNSHLYVEPHHANDFSTK